MAAVRDALYFRSQSQRTLGALAIQTIWLVASIANAATFVVTSSEDTPDAAPGDGRCATAANRCTLRAAVDEANALAGFDHVYLSRPDSSSYVLEHGPLVLSGEIELAGREARWTILDAGGASRVIELAPRAGEPVYARLAGLTLENGFAGASDPHGGAVLNADPASTLVLERSVIRNNRAVGSGGGIYNAGTLEVRRSSLESNACGVAAGSAPAAAGGGIYNLGVATISRSSFEDNDAPLGGGIANASGYANLRHVTLGRNSALARGGALHNAVSATTSLTFCTLTDNEAGIPTQPGEGGGIYNTGHVSLEATIVAGNRDLHSPDSPSYAPDCVHEAQPAAPPSMTSSGGVVIGVVTDRCTHTADPTDQHGSVVAPLDPGLSDSYSGREFEVSWGHELLEGSVAVDAVISPSLCLELDQWGGTRSVDEGGFPLPCDAGAVEWNSSGERRTVMMIVGNRRFAPTDVALSIKLLEYGFEVFDESPSDLSQEVQERQLALISETVTSSELPRWFFSITRPILSLEPGALDELGMTSESWDRTQGVALGVNKLKVLPGSPISTGLLGEVEVTEHGSKFGWGVPATSAAFKLAELASAPGRWAIFGYEKGARLANGTRARSTRVAFFAATDTPQRMNEAGWKLFEATLNYLIPPP